MILSLSSEIKIKKLLVYRNPIIYVMKNEYPYEFLQESRATVNNEGMVGQLIMNEGWIDLNELNKSIEDK